MTANAIKKLEIDKEGWTLVKFGDVVSEGRETVKDFATETIQHVVGLEHIDSENIHLTRSETMAESTTFIKKFKKGDVLFGRRRAYLKKAAQASFSGICSGDITVLRAKKDLLPDLLPFIVCNDKFFDYAVKHSAGGLSPRVKFKDLANYEFLLPPKDQQAKLAELLWAMDEVVGNLHLAYNKCEVLLKSFVEEKLCSKSFPRERLGKGIQNIIAGKSLNGVNISVTNNQKGVLKVSAVGASGFMSEENKLLDEQSEFIEKFKINEGDLLITRANTKELVGRTCIVEKDFPNLMLSDKTLKIEVFSQLLEKEFLVEVLRSLESRNQIEAFATGTGGGMKNISQTEIESIKIPFPNKSIQIYLSRKITIIKNNKNKIKDYLIESKSLQKSLINQIF